MMSTSDKRAGIYMIRNKNDGKVYIGATNNIQGRFRRYLYNYEHYQGEHGGNPDQKRTISYAMHVEGWDAFEFHILEYGPEFMDPEYRSLREIEYIMKYRAIDPKYGYNSTIGGDVQDSSKHPKSLNISPKRSKYRSTFSYDTVTGDVEIQFFGVQTLVKELDQSAMTIRWAIRNGALVKNRYYLFYANRHDRKTVRDFVKACREEAGFNGGGNSQKALINFQKYDKAYDHVNTVGKMYGL